MLRFLPLLGLAGFAAEIASIILVGQALGVVPTLVLLFAGAVLGISLIRSAGTNFFEALRAPVQAASVQKGLAGQTLLRALAGLFLLIPGFLSDLLALLLFFPPVQRWIKARITVETPRPSANPGERFSTVIEAEAIEIRGQVGPAAPGDLER